MNEDNRLERLTSLFVEFLDILEKNNGQNFTRGIKGILAVLTDTNCLVEERIAEVKSTYKSMMGGMGTLGDFTIYPNTKEKEVFLQRLDYVETEIWNLLGLDLSHLPSVDEGYPPGHPYWSIKDPKGET